jgi:peptide/nickel transport system permease protein
MNSIAGRAVLRWLRTTAFSVIPVVIGVVVAVFMLLRLVPGDPARMILGERATPESVAALREQLGLNESVPQQFWNFVVGLVTTGSTGDSLVYGVPSSELVLDRAPITLSLVGLAVLFAVVIAIPLALIAATKRDRLPDHIIRVVPMVGLGMPAFWLGLILILVFAVQLRWFPVGGIGTGPGEPLRSLILPSLTVALGLVPGLVRSLRVELLGVLGADFVTTLTAARVPRSLVLGRHVLRNAAIPTLMLLSVNIAYLLGGTVVIEKVFAINGIGSLMFASIGNRDFPVVQGVALFCAIGVVIVSVVIDAIVELVDPRQRAA